MPSEGAPFVAARDAFYDPDDCSNRQFGAVEHTAVRVCIGDSGSLVCLKHGEILTSADTDSPAAALSVSVHGNRAPRAYRCSQSVAVSSARYGAVKNEKCVPAVFLHATSVGNKAARLLRERLLRKAALVFLRGFDEPLLAFHGETAVLQRHRKGIIMSRPSSRGSCFISSIILLLPPMRHLRTRNFMHIYFILIVPSCQVRRRRICRSTPHIFCSLRIVRKALRRIDKYTIIMYNIKLRNSVRAKVEKRSVHPEKRLSVGGRMPP